MSHAFSSIVLSFFVTGAAFAASKHKHGAHEHGAGKLDVAVEGDVIEIELEVPADDIFGFEHLPKTDAEKKVVADALQTLRTKPLELFVLPAELGCSVKEIEVKSAQESPKSNQKDVAGKHRDVDADIAFKCQKPLAGAVLKLALFSTFPRIKSLKVQVLSGASQAGLTAKSAQDEIKL